MRVDLKYQWIEALKSGKFKQGDSYLKNNEKHCCLGVLCEVSGLHQSAGPGNIVNFHYAGEVSKEVLPFPFQKGVGLSTKDVAMLTYLNDKVKANFDEIAEFINRFIPDDPAPSAKLSEVFDANSLGY